MPRSFFTSSVLHRANNLTTIFDTTLLPYNSTFPCQMLCYTSSKNFIYKPDFIHKIIELRFLYIFNMMFNNCFDSIIDFIEYNEINVDTEVQKYLFMYDSRFYLNLEIFSIMNNNKNLNDYDSDNDY